MSDKDLLNRYVGFGLVTKKSMKLVPDGEDKAKEVCSVVGLILLAAALELWCKL